MYETRRCCLLRARRALLAGQDPRVGRNAFSSSSGRSSFENALNVLDGRAADQYRDSVRLTPGYALGRGRDPTVRRQLPG
ncbi:MAG: hypothetical protein R3D59_17670 [Paracoccaceae bacterium]